MIVIYSSHFLRFSITFCYVVVSFVTFNHIYTVDKINILKMSGRFGLFTQESISSLNQAIIEQTKLSDISSQCKIERLA